MAQAGSSTSNHLQLTLEEKTIVNKDSEYTSNMQVSQRIREPKPSTSFAPESDSSFDEEEEVAGFVEITGQQESYSKHPAKKASCSSMSVCPFCGKKFFSYRVLIVHVTLNHVSESQAKANMHILNFLMKECKMCDYTTPHYSHLKRHMISKHKDYEPFQCHFCDFRTSMQVTLRRHVRLNHTNKKIYQCSKCDFKALTNFSKQIHLNTVHLDSRSVHCSECDFRSKRVSTMRKHIKSNHINKKSHQCSFCGFITDGSRKLKRHITKKHSDEKPFQCTLCSYKAAQFSNFKRHLAFKHCQVYKIISTLSPYI
ncbi:transcriptional repressor CTCF isoform X1 [Halyomorpha halys]|uniref:transcriptional repressor CTCF isoform X1 n=1 Tax=Halyomorpha halys TaxID=286706 RepID=UPI0006D50016|nr:RE1-silencing transcription factor-like isoform X1 [Halyomorpha halys]